MKLPFYTLEIPGTRMIEYSDFSPTGSGFYLVNYTDGRLNELYFLDDQGMYVFITSGANIPVNILSLFEPGSGSGTKKGVHFDDFNQVLKLIAVAKADVVSIDINDL